MRIAIFGDIHANLEAFEVVLADARDQGCASYICLGDVVGYNANPRECLQMVRSLKCPVVKGNHDDYASSDSSLESFNPLAEVAIQWTRDQLTSFREVLAWRTPADLQGSWIHSCPCLFGGSGGLGLRLEPIGRSCQFFQTNNGTLLFWPHPHPTRLHKGQLRRRPAI